MSPHEQYILDQMLVEARVMMMEGSPLELDPSQFSDCVTSLIWLLREAERDAAKYRWLIDNSVFGMKQNGVSWSLSFDGPAPEHSGKIGECIDQAMKEKGDE